MSAKIEQLKADQAKQLAAAIKTEQDHDAIRAAVPAQYVIKNIHPHFCYGDYTIVLEPVPTLSDAIYLAEISDPLAIFKVKDSCLAFMPEPALDKYLAKNKNAVSECIGAYMYQIDGLRQYKQDQTLEFFIDAAGLICRVSIPVLSDPDTRRDYSIKFNRHGEAIREYCRLINKSGHFVHSVSWWSSQDQPNHYTLY